MVNVHGSTAVVTGGQRGLGKALVDELIKRGAFQVYATARRPRRATTREWSASPSTYRVPNRLQPWLKSRPMPRSSSTTPESAVGDRHC